jgi:hypothetical protein
MQTGWLNKLEGITVTRNPQGSFIGKVITSSPAKGGGHTTEGTGLPNYGGNAPTFTIGRDTLWMHRPLGDVCGTLANSSGIPGETNRIVRMQFELVGFSTRELWLPEFSFQRDCLEAIKEFGKEKMGIPPKHVWPDQLPDGIIASPNFHRRHQKWPNVAGWYAHSDVPENSHWDWGSLRWNDLKITPDMVPSYAFVIRVKKDDGTWGSKEASPFFSEKDGLWDWMILGEKGEPGETRLRKEVRAAMLESRCWVAKRKVREDRIKK